MDIYYLTAEFRSTFLGQLRESLNLCSTGFYHADLQQPRIAKDETDVQSIVEMLDSNWINLFAPDPLDLISLSTGTSAPSDVEEDLILGNRHIKLSDNRDLKLVHLLQSYMIK